MLNGKQMADKDLKIAPLGLKNNFGNGLSGRNRLFFFLLWSKTLRNYNCDAWMIRQKYEYDSVHRKSTIEILYPDTDFYFYWKGKWLR